MLAACAHCRAQRRRKSVAVASLPIVLRLGMERGERFLTYSIYNLLLRGEGMQNSGLILQGCSTERVKKLFCK